MLLFSSTIYVWVIARYTNKMQLKCMYWNHLSLWCVERSASFRPFWLHFRSLSHYCNSSRSLAAAAAGAGAGQHGMQPLRRCTEQTHEHTTTTVATREINMYPQYCSSVVRSHQVCNCTNAFILVIVFILMRNCYL